MSEQDTKKLIQRLLLTAIISGLVSIGGAMLISWRGQAVTETNVKHNTEAVQEVKLDFHEHEKEFMTYKDRAVLKDDFYEYMESIKDDIKDIKSDVKELRQNN